MKTITVITSDYGPVTFTEPAWCTRGSHRAPRGRRTLWQRILALFGRRRSVKPTVAPRRSELAHQGAAFDVTVTTPHGVEVLASLALWQDIFPESHWQMGDRVHAIVTLIHTEVGDFDVPDLDQLADSMYGAARQIRHFANQLALAQPRDGGR